MTYGDGPNMGMAGSDLYHPAIDAAMATAHALLGMQAVFIAGLTDEEFVFERINGEISDAREGQRFRRTDTMCHRLVSGAPRYTNHATTDPAYADTPGLRTYPIETYIGVPLQKGDAPAVGTLCGIDMKSIEVSDRAVDVLGELAHVVEAHITAFDRPVIYRTESGWRVGDSEEPDLLSAMVLADLLAPATTTARPAVENAVTEAERLRVTVKQLEHALSARVIVEQAIGVISERHHLQTRAAFERLRRAARSRGRKVQDLAREIVASSADRGVPVPPELAARNV